MRTTITIEEQLLEELKRRAARAGTTVSRLIEESVRLVTDRQTEHEQSPAFELVTFGAGGQFTRFDVDKISAVLEQEDVWGITSP